jgi:hypothetical protein
MANRNGIPSHQASIRYDEAIRVASTCVRYEPGNLSVCAGVHVSGRLLSPVAGPETRPLLRCVIVADAPTLSFRLATLDPGTARRFMEVERFVQGAFAHAMHDQSDDTDVPAIRLSVQT